MTAALIPGLVEAEAALPYVPPEDVADADPGELRIARVKEWQRRGYPGWPWAGVA